METKPIKYYLAEDTIDHKEIDALVEWLKTYPRLTKGELTPKFEKKWSDWLGRKYSVFCNSGSSANLLMYYALILSGRMKNKKIIVPSVGWVTTIAPAIHIFKDGGGNPTGATFSKRRFLAEFLSPKEIVKRLISSIKRGITRCIYFLFDKKIIPKSLLEYLKTRFRWLRFFCSPYW